MAADRPFEIMSAAQSLAAPAEGDDLLAWLASDAGAGRRDSGLDTLLATSYGAVVWGRRVGQDWALSNGKKTLPAKALLDLRAFGPDGEVFVWRDGTGLHARRRQDGAGQQQHVLDETQLLWGTERDDRAAPDGFTALRDGDQGLRHAPPLALSTAHFNNNGHRPARLRLRHYVGRDDKTGVARIVDSRLVKVMAAIALQEDEGGQ